MVAVLALIAAGCGSASSSRTSTSRTAASSRTVPARPAGTVIPAGSVAVVNGSPITQATFDHWMYVAAKSQAAQAPGQPVVVPTDPPGFTRCIAQVRQQIPSLKRTADKTLRADCAQLYRSLSSSVLDFLIKADWIQADGTRHGVLPSQAQVVRAMNTAKDKQFPNGAGYQAFLSKTGQTSQDVLFRFRINTILSGLVAREKGSAAAKQNAVTQREKKLYVAQTHCAPLVTMADCANYRG
jgi:hypothetical protein